MKKYKRRECLTECNKQPQYNIPVAELKTSIYTD